MMFTRLSVAFTVSFALAAAIPDAFPVPEAFAMAVPADGVCSSSDCHAVCGPMIVAARACSENTNSPDAGPWNTECLCPTDSAFMANYEACMGCGQSLWQIYGRFLSSPLGACQGLVTSPTGNVTPCDSSSAPATSASSSTDPTSSDPTSSAPVFSDAVSSVAVSSATVSSDPASSFESSSAPASASVGSTDSSAESTPASVTSSSSVAGNGTITSTFTKDEESTTVITVTSCDEEKCIETPVVTGVTVITKTYNGVVTEYTTYCPVTGTTYAKGVPSTVSNKTETTSTEKTTGKSTVQSSVGTTSVVGATATTAASTSHVISTFEGKAGSLVMGTVGVLFGVMLL